MDDRDRAWFHSKFLAHCQIKTSFDWQSFVTDLMSARHGGLFIQVDPGGRGDKGCDGWVDGLMLACYGATNPDVNYVKKKMDEDFNNARSYWKENMEKWAFVHNNCKGLAYMVAEGLMDLRASAGNSGITLEVWPPQVLWDHCTEKITRQQLADILGAPPSDHPAGISYIARCVESLARTRLPMGLDDVVPVPPGKIEHNKFSPEVADLIVRTQAHTGHVEYYFQQSPPGEQAEVTENLRARYDGFRAKMNDSDAIFHALCDDLIEEAFPSSEYGDEAQQRSASMMVVTHFFEQCEIFEAPPVRG